MNRQRVREECVKQEAESSEARKELVGILAQKAEVEAAAAKRVAAAQVQQIISQGAVDLARAAAHEAGGSSDLEGLMAEALVMAGMLVKFGGTLSNADKKAVERSFIDYMRRHQGSRDSEGAHCWASEENVAGWWKIVVGIYETETGQQWHEPEPPPPPAKRVIGYKEIHDLAEHLRRQIEDLRITEKGAAAMSYFERSYRKAATAGGFTEEEQDLAWEMAIGMYNKCFNVQMKKLPAWK